MRKLLIVMVISACCALSTQAAAGGAGVPTIAFAGNTLRVTGVTPGGTVLIYAVEMVRVDYTDHLERRTQTLQDDDHDGVVTYDRGGPFPEDALWIAIDVTNGQFAYATPRYRVRPAKAPVQPLHRVAGKVDTFSFNYPSCELIYVQPGHGIWAVHAYDGDHADKDSHNGVTAISLADAKPLLASGEAKATEFAPGGIVIAFALPSFRVTTARLTGADIGGAK